MIMNDDDDAKHKQTFEVYSGKRANIKRRGIMPPKRGRRAEHRDSGSHLPMLAPPTAVADKEWYRVASDIMDVKGKYEEEEEDALELGADGSFTQHDRQQWGSQIEFLMSCIATSVGLGNVWRFAFVAYNNGGGAFLIPYMIVLLFVGKPMYYLECLLGQFSSRNSVRVWSCSPGMKGTGYAQTICILYIVSYYVAIVALCLHYLVHSFSSPLPWATCRPEWKDCIASDMSSDVNKSTNSRSSAEIYFIQAVLQQSDGIHGGLGAPIWYLVLCLFAAWIIIFLIVARGVKSSGKAAYFLALFPYVVMIILLISTVILPGAGNGILFFVTPHWKRLIELDVWYAAVTQVFFSLTVGTGPIIMFSSYNGFRSNVHRDSMIVTTLDTFTSLLSGITIFGILGNLAYVMDAEIEDVVGSGGSSLAFISYPDAIAKTFMPQMFSVLFFVMMVVLGIGSSVAFLSTINTVFLDAFPHVRTIYITILNCSLGFLSGLVYLTPGGQYILELVDYYGATFLALFCAICEVVGVIWIYGLENICLDLEYMLGQKTSMYWRICWGIITPVLMITVFIYALFNFQALEFAGYVYPTMAYVSGYILLFFGMIWVPLFIFILLHKQKTGTCREKLKNIFMPKATWGPRERKHRRRWEDFKAKAKRHQASMTTSRCKHLCYSLSGGYRKGLERHDSSDDESDMKIDQNKNKDKDKTQDKSTKNDKSKSSDEKKNKDHDKNKDQGKTNQAKEDANNPFQGRKSAPSPYQGRVDQNNPFHQSGGPNQTNPQNRNSPQSPSSEQSEASDPNSPSQRRRQAQGPKSENKSSNQPSNPDNDDGAGPSSGGQRRSSN